MIPKKIHYCWLSGEELPQGLQACIRSWRKILPDYELIRWDRDRIDLETNSFVAEAVAARRWAFASDYIRLHALYVEGGIYLDADVLVRKRFDPFLGHGFFSGIEYHSAAANRDNWKTLVRKDASQDRFPGATSGIGIQAAIMGAIKGHPFLKACLDYYTHIPFANYLSNCQNTAIAPDIYAQVATEYGFQYRDCHQVLREDMAIYPSSVFAPTPAMSTRASVAIHYCAGSWKNSSQGAIEGGFLRWLKQRPIVRKLLGKAPHLEFR